MSESSPAISAPPPIPGQSAGGKKKLPALYPFSRALSHRKAGRARQPGRRADEMMEEGDEKEGERVNFHRPTHDCPEKTRPPALPAFLPVRADE